MGMSRPGLYSNFIGIPFFMWNCQMRGPGRLKSVQQFDSLKEYHSRVNKKGCLFRHPIYGKQHFRIWRNMFSGIQEILVLVAIILGILVLPRILSRGQEKKPTAAKPAVVISGKMRMAIAASILWPAAVAAFMQPWENDFFPFLYIGLGPVIIGGIIFWVYTGFLRK